MMFLSFNLLTQGSEPSKDKCYFQNNIHERSHTAEPKNTGSIPRCNMDTICHNAATLGTITYNYHPPGENYR